MASCNLKALLSQFLDRHFAAEDVAEFKRIKGEDPANWVERPEGEAPSEVDVLRIRHLVRFWVSYDADRVDITQRMLDMQDKLLPFRPTTPVQVYRNEKLEGEDGWDQQYDFASAWSTSLEAARAFEGDQERRLVTALALPEDILVSVPVVDAWAQVYDLGVVDAEEDDEVVVIPHPSFEHDRTEVKDEPEPKAKTAANDGQAFRSWFGQSKVVDAQGHPLKVFHGTSHDFDKFTHKHRGRHTNSETGYQQWSHLGFHFTDDPGYASDHATAQADSGGRVIPVYLSLQNPLEMSDAEWHETMDAFDEGETTAKEVQARIQARGYDGIILRDADDFFTTSDHFIAFNSNQIKSAISSGFNPNDTRITAAVGDLGDGDAATTDPTGQFWGHAGAGCVFVAEDTGRVLLPLRSAEVNEPNCWGVWGGAIDDGENPQAAALREVHEETGYRGSVRLERVYLFTQGAFHYTTFLAYVPHEFEPELNWESAGFRWCTPGQWPSPLHYGLRAALPALTAKLGKPKHAKLLQPKLAAAPKLPDLQPIMQEFLAVLDPEGKCTPPKIGYVSNSSNTLGLCRTDSLNLNQDIVTGANSVITVQKGLVVDLNHLRKVVAHEVCHHVAIHAMVLGKPIKEAQEALAAIGDGHGSFWQAEAEKINQRYGEGFVTQLSDMNSLEWEVRPAYLFIMQIPGRPRPVYCWAPTVSSKIIMSMAEYVQESLATAYVVKTKNRFLTQPYTKAPEWWSPVTPQEAEALQAAIAGAQREGNLFASFLAGDRKTRKAPGRPWTLIMVNPKRGATGEPAVVNAWALGRKLNDQEMEQLKQVRELGIEFRRQTMSDGDDLRESLPKLNMNDVMYNPARVSPDVYEVQTYLKWLWNNTVTGRTAKLLQPKLAGPNMSQVVKRVGHSEAAYQALGQAADTFQTGGCWMFAEALHRAVPGSKLEVLASKRWAAEHVVVNVGGRLYDSDGGFSPEQMVKKFQDEWGLEVQLMPFHVDKAAQANFVFDEPVVKALAELFSAALGKAKLASPLKLPEGLVEDIAANLARQGVEYLTKQQAKGFIQLSQVGDEWRRWNQIGMVYRDTIPVQGNALARFKGGINYDLAIASKVNIPDSLVTEGERRSKTENGVTSNVVVTIALNPTRSIADAIAELGNPGSEGFRSLVAMLAHEITHVFGHRYPKAKPIPKERDWNPEAYANHPTELDAFTQEMVARALQNPAVQADEATVQQAVEQVLREPRWATGVGSRLTEQNRRRILREVYLAVARMKERPKAAKLLGDSVVKGILAKFHGSYRQRLLRDLGYTDARLPRPKTRPSDLRDPDAPIPTKGMDGGQGPDSGARPPVLGSHRATAKLLQPKRASGLDLSDPIKAWAWAERNVDDIGEDEYEQADTRERVEVYCGKFYEVQYQPEVTIYRMVVLPAIEDLDPARIGTHWSFEKRGAGDYGLNRAKTSDDKNWLLTGVVSPRDIDWEYGLVSFIGYGEDQWECALRGGAPVKVVGINGQALPKPIPCKAFNVNHVGPMNSRTASAPTMGFNVSDDDQDYTGMILSGHKTIETRNSPSLSAHLGERVGIISTSKRGMAALVGTCVLGEPKIYRTHEEFRADQQAHHVPEGPEYDPQPGAPKYGYPISQVESCEPTIIRSQGRVWRKLAAGESAVMEAPDVAKLVEQADREVPLQAPARVDPTTTPQFKAWFSTSKVVDAQGRPKVVYHGSTHAFDQFSMANGNDEGFYGKGFYFTDSKVDVNENYAKDSGADLTGRIEQRAEQIMEQLESDSGEDAGWGSPWQRAARERAMEQAKKEIAGQSLGMVYLTYLRMLKPVVVQPSGGTRFEGGHWNPRDEDEYIESRVHQKMYDSTLSACQELGCDGDQVWREVNEKVETYDGYTAYQFEQAVRGCTETYDVAGGPGPLLSRIWQLMGFDGVIMDAEAQFDKMEMSPGTRHYIVWNPRQVKSALGNAGTFSPRSPRITAKLLQPKLAAPYMKFWVKPGTVVDTSFVDVPREHAITAVDICEAGGVEPEPGATPEREYEKPLLDRGWVRLGCSPAHSYAEVATMDQPTLERLQTIIADDPRGTFTVAAGRDAWECTCAEFLALNRVSDLRPYLHHGTLVQAKTADTKSDVTAVRSFLRDWVGGGWDDRERNARLAQKHEAILAKYKPTQALRLWRNERVAAPGGNTGLNNHGWEDQYQFPTAWSTVRAEAETYASGPGRKLVTAIVPPEDMLVCIPIIDRAARSLGLKPIDQHGQSEVVVKANPSFLAQRRAPVRYTREQEQQVRQALLEKLQAFYAPQIKQMQEAKPGSAQSIAQNAAEQIRGKVSSIPTEELPERVKEWEAKLQEWATA